MALWGITQAEVSDTNQITLVELLEASKSCLARLPRQMELVHGDTVEISNQRGFSTTCTVATVFRGPATEAIAVLRFRDAEFHMAKAFWETSRSLAAKKISGLTIEPETDTLHTIKAKATIRTMGALVSLLLTIDGREEEIPLSSALAPSTVRFDEDGDYTFFLLERFVDGRLPRGFDRFCLVRADFGGRTVYDRSVCEIHKVDMTMKLLPLASGLILPGPGDPDDDARAARFPHARETILSGCGPTEAASDYGYVCEQCQKAEYEWRLENERKPEPAHPLEPSQSSGR